ncbi:MAG: hypothetical protein ACFFC7_33990 [Candidatus Hermodarchaeota archaeon]
MQKLDRKLARSNIFSVVLLFVFTSMLLTTSCASTKEKIEKRETEQRVEIKGGEKSEHQKLSYGMVTSKVKKGITNQNEILELFGAPNITTIDSDQIETWVYELTSSSTKTITKEKMEAQTKRFDFFFGFGLYGKESGEQDNKTTTIVERSIKTLTVIIKFNNDPNKTVAEYTARASYF